jgi:hypothetical protein
MKAVQAFSFAVQFGLLEQGNENLYDDKLKHSYKLRM